MKSSQSIWHLLHNVKKTMKIFPIFVAFLENINYNLKVDDDKRKCILRGQKFFPN